MTRGNGVKILLSLAILLIVVILGLYLVLDNEKTKKDWYDKKEKSSSKSDLVLIEMYSNKVESSNNPIIVSDRYVKSLDNGNYVFLDSQGNAYVVKGDRAYVSEMLIQRDNKGYSLIRTDNYEKSIE